MHIFHAFRFGVTCFFFHLPERERETGECSGVSQAQNVSPSVSFTRQPRVHAFTVAFTYTDTHGVHETCLAYARRV